jgi:hypothetical protein
MHLIGRRDFLRTTLTGSLAWGVAGRPHAAVAGANDAVRVAIVGLGGIDTVGGVGGRGRQLIRRLQEVSGVRITALCDVDQEVLNHELQPFQERHEQVAVVRGRRLPRSRRASAATASWPTLSSAVASICVRAVWTGPLRA